jgi:uncharacterized NAD-dependent epimerase/dehydratase family protein
MSALTRITISAPYLILIGDTTDVSYAKTGAGIVHWQPEKVIGQLRFSRHAIDLGIPDLTAEEARKLGARSLLIGVAPAGGTMPAHWWDTIEEAAGHGLDIVSGLHLRLAHRSSLERIAQRSGARLIDVRVPPPNIPVATGRRRSGKRLLTVGTDCSIGKKYTALALHSALREAGIDSTFRATGQTGIMLAGEGIPIDAVVADFAAGAAEQLSPDNRETHWDVIEGQGSLFHPAYAGIALSLLHGSQPDAIVIAHDAERTQVSGWPGFALPSVVECVEQALRLGRRTNPGIRCVGVSVNTMRLDAATRSRYLAELSQETGLPCFDPLVDGCALAVQQIQKFWPETTSP